MSNVPTITLRDDTTIPQLGFGTWKITDDEAQASVEQALAIGYRHIDTAALYANEAGIGKALAGSGIARQDLYLTTKVWNDRQLEARASLEESLAKLGTDHVDLFLIHWPHPSADTYVQCWRDMVALREEGLATSIGVCNFNVPHLQRLLDEVGEVPVVNQVELHPSFTQKDLESYGTGHGIATEAWAPIGRGADLADEGIRSIADQLGRTPAQVILRWHLQQGRIVFPKSVREERIRENFDVLDFELTADDLARVDAVDAGNRLGPDPDTM
ncbi:2,5-diketo-D-gluconate reductase A [Raineyella antarctica]|uniref:2,5-diketo-D-gluconate reductase A n=1 Tax=Raineyella antarctica TaxID=1577474 RepID=A0A1G6GFC5_9ACTN|nr:aldo/keto reductase [Raineyella antarctica]SDB80670.1 2,5-diketo-D-gluconate reductase A [Raineyella antarctica]